MKRSPTLLRKLLPFVLLPLAAWGFEEREWGFRQGFDLTEAGVVKVAVPLETLDRLRADHADLRLQAPDGTEVPFVLLQPAPTPARWVEPVEHKIRLLDASTEVTLRTTEATVDAVELQTAAPRFLKAARVELSEDGEQWRTVQEGAPFFRQQGAEQTQLRLGTVSAKWMRITLDDRRHAAVPVTGVRVRAVATDDRQTERISLRVAQMEHYAQTTSVTLVLPAANLDWESVGLRVTDALFTRSASTTSTRFVDGEATEVVLGGGTVFRVRIDDQDAVENTHIPLQARVPGRELTLRIENGDSPPLHVTEVQGMRRVQFAVFAAPGPGTYQWWSGNVRAQAPRYDVDGLRDRVRSVPERAAPGRALEENPSHQKTNPLAALGAPGARLDPAQWSRRQAVDVTTPGIQRLDLDLTALTTARPDAADVRLVNGDRQLPYVLQRPPLERDVPVSLDDAPDAQRPDVSRWSVKLPVPGARLSGLVLQSSSPLFDRIVRVVERRTPGTSRPWEAVLAHARWQRRPEDAAATLRLDLSPHEGGPLWLEIEDGDNPPLQVTAPKGVHPVIRLIFAAETPGKLTLLTGNQAARPPHYDLQLIAERFASSPKAVASLASQPESTTPASSSRAMGSALFWSALGALVVGLLVIVAKLLPKPPKT